MAAASPTPYLKLARRIMNGSAGPALADLDDLAPLTAAVVELIQDRLDAGWREGLLPLTPEQFTAVQCALLPDDEVPRRPPSTEPPVSSTPGSANRLADYRRRVAGRLPLALPGDVELVRADRDGLRVRRRGNPTTPADVKVLGPSRPAPRPIPAGLYFLPDGRRIELEEPD